MSNVCFPILRGRRLRATRLDGCGNPVLGPDSVVITKGFISVALTANNEEGEEINVTNANGDVCVLDTPLPKLKNYSVEITFCDVNPVLVNLMSGQPLVMNGTDTVGFRMNSEIDASAQGFALELWTGVASDTCSTDGTSYGYLLLPFLQGGTLGDFTVENAAINFTLTGAITKKGSPWGVGPYDVVMDAGVPSPLAEAITSGDHLHLERTTVAPPDADCDPVALGVEATGVTAGSPGSFTPTNSYAPADFTELLAAGYLPPLTAAWTTGQYITLRDGSYAHWDGTSWVVGITP
jgi:hypothetical protein